MLEYTLFGGGKGGWNILSLLFGWSKRTESMRNEAECR